MQYKFCLDENPKIGWFRYKNCMKTLLIMLIPYKNYMNHIQNLYLQFSKMEIENEAT